MRDYMVAVAMERMTIKEGHECEMPEPERRRLLVLMSTQLSSPQQLVYVQSLIVAESVKDTSKCTYPSGISPPSVYSGGSIGVFKYDLKFLLQFQNICKQKPLLERDWVKAVDELPGMDAVTLAMQKLGLRSHDKKCKASMEENDAKVKNSNRNQIRSLAVTNWQKDTLRGRQCHGRSDLYREPGICFT